MKNDSMPRHPAVGANGSDAAAPPMSPHQHQMANRPRQAPPSHPASQVVSASDPDGDGDTDGPGMA
jgi:hypothetical protein